jgi:hypothetical protein
MTPISAVMEFSDEEEDEHSSKVSLMEGGNLEDPNVEYC